jgi:hypothetical protein
MPVLSPDHLLEQADRLVSSRSGAPRQADLRRAISSAYYAVFHAILTEGADEFVGRTQRQTPRYELVYRSIDHRVLRRLCEDVARDDLPKKLSQYEPPGGFGQELKGFAAAMVDLQERRHLADYGPLFRADVSGARLAVATARTALSSLRNMSSARRKAFLTLLLFSPR